MVKPAYYHWNHIVYYVSELYYETKKFNVGMPEELGSKIRKTAVSISAVANDYASNNIQEENLSKIYPIISSVSVLETYLQLAKNYKYLKDTTVLDEKLKEVKKQLLEIVEQSSEA